MRDRSFGTPHGRLYACVHGGDVRAWLVTEEYRVGVSGEWFFTCLSFSHPQRQSADETQRQSVDSSERHL